MSFLPMLRATNHKHGEFLALRTVSAKTGNHKLNIQMKNPKLGQNRPINRPPSITSLQFAGMLTQYSHSRRARTTAGYDYVKTAMTSQMII
jgi:hypothetical protein